MRHGGGTHEKKNRLQTLLMFLRTFTLVKIILLTKRSFSLSRNKNKNRLKTIQWKKLRNSGVIELK